MLQISNLITVIVSDSVTKPIKLDVENKGVRMTKNGKVKSRFIATGTLDRYDYGLKWNEVTEAGGMIFGKDVTIVLDFSLAKIDSKLSRK